MITNVFLQDPVDSRLWLFATDQLMATICHYWDILRLTVSSDVCHDRSVPYPACSCSGSPLW